MKRFSMTACAAPGLLLLTLIARPSAAQTCNTQAAMPAAMRQSLAGSALSLATAVKADDANAVKGASVAAVANNFAQAAYAVQNTAAKLDGDSLRVSNVYLLNASALKPAAEADFTCALAGSASEVDFSITGLEAGVYGFAMVEADGPHPWLLSFLLRQVSTADAPDVLVWAMAGFYPHARTAAGKDGLWYWNDARAKAAAKQAWLAWLAYGQADALLAPAPFVSSTNLDKLRTERRQAAPPALADGISVDQPLTLKDAAGQDVRFTSLAGDSTDDGATLRLVLHYAAAPGPSREQVMRAAATLLAAHPELRLAYPSLLVFGDAPDQNPVVFSGPTSQIQP
jgi:hypothetical protein